MEPAHKKARLTDHFRVALKPRDLNVAVLRNKQQENKQQPIEVITIGDETSSSSQQVESKQQLLQSRQQQHLQTKLKINENRFGLQTEQQTLPLKLVTFSSQQQQQQQQQPTQIQTQQPRQHLGLIAKNNHSQAKGKRSSFGNNCLDNNINNVTLCKNKSITSYLVVKREPSPLNKYVTPPGKHINVVDFDKSMLNNIWWEPHYAWDSFNYDRQQEIKYQNKRPLCSTDNQVNDDSNNGNGENQQYAVITKQRRQELVDWLVDVQINFDLDHEPLYMAVKLVDQYLMRKQVTQDNHVLLFMVSMLISAKFDERIPPITIEELLQLTKSRFAIRYTRKQVVSFEVDVLTTLQFDIRYPLSYGFLRRFARSTRTDTRTLFLARYILESSLMDQDMIEVIESKIAAGSLLLALEMLHKNGVWDETARYYTGYEEKELYPLVFSLNKMITKLSKRRTAIRRKYSHEQYMGVARIPSLLLDDCASDIFLVPPICMPKNLESILER